MISGFLKRKCSGQKGFTLIEMSAVLLILGLLVAAGGRLYTQWLEFKAVEDTRTDITTANLALQNFLETYGRYPCPAGLTIDRDDPDYGRETDCADTSVAVGGTGTVDGKADAYYVVASQRAAVTYKSRSTGTDTTEVPRIRIGALPFRMLGLEEEEAYDGWRRRLMYAVTENLGVSDIFEPEDGGVTIWNDQNASMTAEPDAAHFIVFSYGENGIGGYNYAGGRVPCAVAGPEETINCNIDTDAIFKIAAMNTSGGASHNDDMFVFSQADIPLWQLADGNPEDGVNKGTKTGVGAVASDNPNEELTVDGTVRAFDDPSTPAEEGNILSNSLCDHASATTDCFPSSLIAGSLSPPQPQHGMECPPGRVYGWDQE
ncbi:MAG: type II secretion system protein [Alphaproteobacteria bacterium]